MIISISADPVPLNVDASGTIRVAGTRLTLESLLAVYLQGKTPEEITACFDGITLGDVYAVLGYYWHHQAEVDAYLAQQEAASEAAWRELEAQGAPGARGARGAPGAGGSAEANPFRERVLSRRVQTQQHDQTQQKEC